VIFWQDNIGEKAAHKMLVKLSIGGAFNGVPLFCGGKTLTSFENRCYKYDKSWKPVILN